MSRSRAARPPSRNAHRLLAEQRRGDRAVPALTIDQIAEQLALAVDRVMAEGSLYDRELAALAIKQARGDLIEAIFLVRAYRTTLPRFGYSRAARHRRHADRAAHLGDLQGPARRPAARPDLRLHPPPARLRRSTPSAEPPAGRSARRPRTRRARASPTSSADEGLIEPRRGDRRTPRRRPHARAAVLPRRPRPAPAGAGARRRGLPARARLFDAARLCAAPIPSPARSAWARSRSSSTSPELGFAVRARRASRVTECQMVNQFKGTAEAPPQFTRGYGLVFGQPSARRWRWRSATGRCGPRELGEELTAPAQDEEFVHLALRQRPGDRLRRAPEAAALCRLPGRARPDPPAPRRARGAPRRGGAGSTRGGRGMTYGPPTTSPISTSRPSG